MQAVFSDPPNCIFQITNKSVVSQGVSSRNKLGNSELIFIISKKQNIMTGNRYDKVGPIAMNHRKRFCFMSFPPN